jgi:hypothetical protein
MLYMLSKRDTFMGLECLSSGPSITQKMRVIFLVRLLLSNVRVDKYPLMTNDASLRARLVDLANTYQHPSCRAMSVAEGFDPISRSLISPRSSVPREWVLPARQALLLSGRANDKPPIRSPRAGVGFETACRVHLPTVPGRPRHPFPKPMVYAPCDAFAPLPVAPLMTACRTADYDYRGGWGPVSTLREFDLTPY